MGNFLRIDVDAYGMTPLLAASVTGRDLMRIMMMVIMMMVIVVVVIVMVVTLVVWSA